MKTERDGRRTEREMDEGKMDKKREERETKRTGEGERAQREREKKTKRERERESYLQSLLRLPPAKHTHTHDV